MHATAANDDDRVKHNDASKWLVGSVGDWSLSGQRDLPGRPSQDAGMVEPRAFLPTDRPPKTTRTRPPIIFARRTCGTRSNFFRLRVHFYTGDRPALALATWPMPMLWPRNHVCCPLTDRKNRDGARVGRCCDRPCFFALAPSKSFPAWAEAGHASCF